MTLSLRLGIAILALAGGTAQALEHQTEAGCWVDLTHPYSSDTVYWPTSSGFEKTTVSEGVTDQGFYYSAYAISTAEHGGTHLDAPVHFHQDGQGVDEIPLDRLIGDAAVIDVSKKALADRDYLIGVQDIVDWEAAHDRIPDQSIVMFHTGYAAYWPDAEDYLGTAMRGAEALPLLHFPGIHEEAARFLVQQRSIKAIGLDTASLDYGQTSDYPSHQIFAAANIPGFENLTGLDRLPATGAFVVALPMKIEGGSGGPLRAVARIAPSHCVDTEG